MTDGDNIPGDAKPGLQGQSSAKKIFQNFSFLTIGKTLGDVFVFVFFVVLSRFFGQEGLGQYSLAVAIGGFFVVFVDFGLYALAIKEMSRDHNPAGDYYGGVVTIRAMLAIVAFTLLMALLYFLPFSSQTKLVIGLVSAAQIIYVIADGLAAAFVAREDMHLAAFMEFLLRASTSLVGIVIAVLGGSLAMVLATLPLITLTLLFVAFRMVSKRYGRPKLAVSPSYVARLLREAVPYGLAGFLHQLSTRVDVMFLGFLLGEAAAGVYNAAYRIVFLLTFLPTFASLSLFPMASRLYVTSRTELDTLYHQSLSVVLIISIPASAGLWLIAPELIDLIFGRQFAESVTLLQLLAVLLLLSSLKSIMGMVLTASDRQIEGTKILWTAAWINVVGNSVLIPTIGIEGAAIATVVSEIILVILLMTRLQTLFGWPQVGSRLAISGLGTAAFCVPFILIESAPIIVVMPLSALLYAATLFCFRDVRENEMRMVMRLLNRKVLANDANN